MSHFNGIVLVVALSIASIATARGRDHILSIVLTEGPDVEPNCHDYRSGRAAPAEQRPTAGATTYQFGATGGQPIRLDLQHRALWMDAELNLTS